MSKTENEKTRELLDSFAKEKKLISYDMHDGLIQLLVGSLMQLESIDPVALNLGLPTTRKLDASIMSLREAVEIGRKLIADLRAASIEKGALPLELKQLVHSFQGAQPAVYSQFDGELAEVDPLVGGTVYGVVREALNNVQKHSNAAAAWVMVTTNERECEIIIVDDGDGTRFDQQLGGHFGIEGIKERARMFGGESRFFSSKMNLEEFEKKLVECSGTDRFFSAIQSLQSGSIIQTKIPWRHA